MRIAIDGMGGDFGPRPIVEGVVQVLEEVAEFHPFLVGDEEVLKELLPNRYHNRVTFVHASDAIGMDENGANAPRRKESSIYKAIQLLREGEVEGVVSAGHSGATMSVATLRLGRIKGIKRPAIVTFMPNRKGSYTLVLDVGANVDCEPDHLYQFGIMGGIYGKVVLGKGEIKIGLLSNGEEEGKGNRATKEAHRLLKKVPGFIGNVEGGDVFTGEVDVVVCDGFVGNIFLKTSEGAGEAVAHFLKEEIERGGILVKLGALLMRPAFRALKKRIDYAEYGGAPLLGVNGCVIISHGKSNAKAIKNGIKQAITYIRNDVTAKIATAIEQINGEVSLPQPERGAEAS
jgi:glycerol-3-phosphate acyltransferase PlsX